MLQNQETAKDDEGRISQQVALHLLPRQMPSGSPRHTRLSREDALSRSEVSLPLFTDVILVTAGLLMMFLFMAA